MKTTYFLKFLFLLAPFIIWGQPSPEFDLPTDQSYPGYRIKGRVTIEGVNADPADWIGIFDPNYQCIGLATIAISGVTGQSSIVNTIPLQVDNPTDDPSGDGGLECITNIEILPGISYFFSGCEQISLIFYDASTGLFYLYPTTFTHVDVNSNLYVDALENDNQVINFTGPPTEILPIQLLFFKAKIIYEAVLLDWASLAEVNNSHFEIEHSTNGRVFEKIGEVKGAGTYSGLLNYEFIDESPNIGLNYYRLKQVDFDGQFEYSKVITVNFDRKNSDDLEVFPNPTSAFADILLPESLTDRETVITLHDFAGREVLRRKEQPSNSVRLELEGLPAGYYTINVRSGNETFIKPLVIQ